MMDQKILNLENVEIGFRNFEGKEGPYNSKGNRNFVVFLDETTADTLMNEGWNVKRPKEKDDVDPAEDTRQPYLPVSISTNAFPSKIVIVSNGKTSQLDDESYSMLDWAEISNVDIVIRPYNWEVNGKSGIKAYVKAMYVTLFDDAFASKYEI